MNKVWSRVFGFAVAAAAIVGVAATTTSEAAADNACVPDIEVTNDRGAEIKVTKVQYRVVPTGTFYTEDLGNQNLSKNGGSHTWKSQKLAKSSIGNDLEFKVEWEDGFNNHFTTPILGTIGVCGNSRTYHLKVK